MRPAEPRKPGRGSPAKIDPVRGAARPVPITLPGLADRTKCLPDGWLRISPGLAMPSSVWLGKSACGQRSPESRAGAHLVRAALSHTGDCGKAGKPGPQRRKIEWCGSPARYAARAGGSTLPFDQSRPAAAPNGETTNSSGRSHAASGAPKSRAGVHICINDGGNPRPARKLIWLQVPARLSR
jgi:hypothetical protein